MRYEIYILDTGDNYIIAQRNAACISVLRIYNIMDISVNQIPTGVYVDSDDEFNFIVENIGRNIIYGLNDVQSIHNSLLGKLIDDIKTTLEFYKLTDFWKKLNINPDVYNKLVYDRAMDNPIISTVSFNGIIFNTLYNIAIYIDHSHNIDLNDVEKYFPEMYLVYSDESDEHRKTLQDIFHLKTFKDLNDIVERISGFKKLYCVTFLSINEEKEKVEKFLNNNFIVSDDIDKRIKANDLYKEFIQLMCIEFSEAPRFKKRLSGYLLEFNLKKKRFSDGYFYYGIVWNGVPDLKDLMASRANPRTIFSLPMASVT